jgi:hypothetical protein
MIGPPKMVSRSVPSAAARWKQNVLVPGDVALLPATFREDWINRSVVIGNLAVPCSHPPLRCQRPEQTTEFVQEWACTLHHSG